MWAGRIEILIRESGMEAGKESENSRCAESKKKKKSRLGDVFHFTWARSYVCVQEGINSTRGQCLEAG